VAQRVTYPGLAGGLRPHGAKAETEHSLSLTGEKSSPNLIFNRICSESKQKMCGIGVRILHELLGEKTLYKETSLPDFWIETDPLTLASRHLAALPLEDFPSRAVTIPTMFESEPTVPPKNKQGAPLSRTGSSDHRRSRSLG
jgi:hypothetical protein